MRFSHPVTPRQPRSPRGPFSLGLAGAPLLSASVLVACSAPLATPAGDSVERDAAEGASSAALVVVERTVTADESVRGSAVARFVRMRTGAIDDETLRMVGATLDLPSMGTCSTAGRANEASEDKHEALVPGSPSPGSPSVTGSNDGPRAVELLDVGSLALEANGFRASLEARALPDIVDLVTGVLYSARTTASAAGSVDAEGLANGIPGRATYVLRSTGSSRYEADRRVPAFSVAADAPGEPEELRIEGQDARASDGVVLTAGSSVELSWSSSVPRSAREPAPDGNDDVVYVELVAGAGTDAPGPSIRCLFADRGTATVPAAAFLTHDAELAHGLVVVHRVHRETFQVGGIDSGVIRFDFARAAEFTRR